MTWALLSVGSRHFSNRVALDLVDTQVTCSVGWSCQCPPSLESRIQEKLLRLRIGGRGALCYLS